MILKNKIKKQVRELYGDPSRNRNKNQTQWQVYEHLYSCVAIKCEYAELGSGKKRREVNYLHKQTFRSNGNVRESYGDLFGAKPQRRNLARTRLEAEGLGYRSFEICLSAIRSLFFGV